MRPLAVPEWGNYRHAGIVRSVRGVDHAQQTHSDTHLLRTRRVLP
jgi:hypothetical protein